MPYGEDIFYDGSMSPPLIQSDLLNSVEPEPPKDSGAGAGPTVVTLDGRAGLIDEQPRIPEADMDIQNDIAANFPASAPSSALKKRGRPSLSGSPTPARSTAAKTPRSSKSTPAPKSAGRSTGKRKAAEPEPEPEENESEENEPEDTPAAKRSRPGRAVGASASARLAAKAANKPTRGRPKSTATASKPAEKVGRPKKETNGEVPEDEYEVEDIVDSVIDADTMEHMYFVKWKNYPGSQNTWEPKKNLKGSLDLVRKFDAKKTKAEAGEAAKKAAAKKTAAAASREKKATGRKSRAAKAVKEVKVAKKAPGRPARKRRARA